MDGEIVGFLIRTLIVTAVLILFLYWRYRDSLLTKIMFAVSPFLIVMSTSSFLNAKLGATVPWVKIAGPITVIVVGILSIWMVNKFSRIGLNKMLETLVKVTNQISDSSSDISSKSSQLASGAHEQRNFIRETSGSLKEGANIAKTSVEISQRAMTISKEAETSFNKGMKLMAQVNEVVGKIQQNSHKSASFIKVIEGIALQTNILSLNAAVEAQRAGVAGQGFAVVADEVRALAGKVSDSTKQIESMMSDSELYARNSNDNTKQLTKVLEGFREQINSFIDIIGEMRQNAEKQKDLMQNISHQIEEVLTVANKFEDSATDSKARAKMLEEGVNLLLNARKSLGMMINGSAFKESH